MIDYFESSIRINPDAPFFTFVDDDGTELTYTYWQTRLASASLARKFQAAGISAGNAIALDLPNCPEFIFTALACAYGGLAMVLLDHTLSEGEKLSRKLDAERAGLHIACTMDTTLANQVFHLVRSPYVDEVGLVRSIYGTPKRDRAIMGEGQDAIDDTVHFAEREAHLFERESLAVVMFAASNNKPGRRGDKPKAVPLTWANLMDSSIIANDALAAGGVRLWQERLPFNSISLNDSGHISRSDPEFVWQCALSLSNIDGLQTVVRSIVARNPFRLYTGHDAELILRDSERSDVTHIAVDDALLQDILTVEEWRSDVASSRTSRLACYRCVLFVGRTSPARTIKRTYELGARLFLSYGIPQTSGVIALALVTSDYRGGLLPIEGLEIRIVDPDEEGFGRMAVRSPGVFGGYASAQTAFTVDRFFITEEIAACIDNHIFIRSRAENMFVSAGQNIYPVEIADVLRHVSGVSGVHVFGVADSRCGMLPIAVLERSDPALTPQMVEEMTRQWFTGISVPISIFVYDQLPRTQAGKLDRRAIEAIFTG